MFRDYLRRCAEGEGGRARLAVEGYANADTAYYFAREAAHYARLLMKIESANDDEAQQCQHTKTN